MKNETSSTPVTLESSLKALELENFLDRHFFRPLGFKIALSLRNRSITPNQVTLFSIFIGVSAGLFFYPNDFIFNLIGVLLLITANTLDCVDGQLARLTGIKSRLGRILDGFAGDLWFASIYISISLRLINEGWSTFIFFIAILSGLSHSRQAAMADYFKNFHLFILKGSEGSELDESDLIKKNYRELGWKTDFGEKFTLFFYSFYTRSQELTSPLLHGLRSTIQIHFPNGVPNKVKERFNRLTTLGLRSMHALSFNGRVPFLILVVLSDLPWLYFIFEILILNLVLMLGVREYESVAKKMVSSIESGEYAKG